MTIGRNVATRRRVLGITQTELGAHVHMSKSIVGMIETNMRVPSLKQLFRIAGALGVEAAALLKGVRSV